MLGNKFKTLYQPSYVDDGLPGQACSADLGPPLVGAIAWRFSSQKSDHTVHCSKVQTSEVSLVWNRL